MNFLVRLNILRLTLPLNKGIQHAAPTTKVRIPSVESFNRRGAHGTSNSVAWIDIERVPLCVWSQNTFDKIFSKWSSLLHEEEENDSYFHRKRLCIKTSIGDNIFESFKIIVKGKTYWIRAKEVTGWAPKFFDNQDVSSDSDVSSEDVNDDALSENGKEDSYSEANIIPETVFEKGEVKSSDIKEKSNEMQQEAQSEDPFKIYDLFKTKYPVSNVARQYEDEPMYSPGFTPCDNSVNINSSFYEAKIHQKESSEKENGSKTCFKEDVNALVCSGHFKKKCLKNKRSSIDISLDKGEAISAMLDERLNIMNDLTSLENNVSLELAQKAKIKWAIKDGERIPGAKMVKDFRPISLIGSLYKIISKLLANRLVTVMSDLVNEFQSTFIANRKILYGPFMLNEIIHWCKSKKKQTMIFKVDFKKAFDSVHWDFLDDVMANFSFDTRWCDWILNCLKSQGVRSLLMEALLWNSSSTKDVRLFFRASGLCINLHKSKLNGIVVDQSKVEAAASNIGCMALNLPFLYLGIIIGGNMSRIKAWDYVINKVLCRLSKWKMKILSICGRFTLLKSVLGALLIYFMSMFNAPIQVIKKLESIRNHFFIGVDSNVQKMMLIKWDNVLASKEKGGLSVSSFYALNLANKMAHSSLASSLRRNPKVDGEFLVASVRNLIDDRTLAEVGSKTRWIMHVSIKVNILAWRIKLNNLPSRLNLSRRGLDLDTIFCPSCNLVVDSSNHIFFGCPMVKDLYKFLA
nr:RNA-directed DNA polymerase, eukaryota, reverse transcriptase zinc-binding domain protein [Tanacetum cinerariifolium]